MPVQVAVVNLEDIQGLSSSAQGEEFVDGRGRQVVKVILEELSTCSSISERIVADFVSFLQERISERFCEQTGNAPFFERVVEQCTEVPMLSCQH